MKRDIVLGFVILALIAGGIYFSRRGRQQEAQPSRTPSQEEVEKTFEDKFKLEIPEDVEKVELKDVANVGGSGFATRLYKDGKFTHTILADLPDPEAGSFYQAWLVKGIEGSPEYAVISTGRLRMAKGGWLLEFSSAKDYTEYNKVMVTQEKVSDQKLEKAILEASF